MRGQEEGRTLWNAGELGPLKRKLLLSVSAKSPRGCDHAFCLSCIRGWRREREQQAQPDTATPTVLT